MNKAVLSKHINTIKNLKKTAEHHYGKNVMSIPKFIYNSMVKINTFILVGFDLSKEIPELPMDDEFEVSKPSIEELENLRKGKDLPREFYYDQFHGVANCYVAQSNGELAYIHWIYVKGDYNRFLRLSDDVAELNYNTTLPKFRGKRLMAKMLVYILNDLKQQNYRMAVGVTNKDNPAAVKSVVRSGFDILAEIRTVGPFNRKVKV